MDDKIYKITLADGTVIDNLKLNGNNFISPVEIDETIFDGNCLNVTTMTAKKTMSIRIWNWYRSQRWERSIGLYFVMFQKMNWLLLNYSRILNI